MKAVLVMAALAAGCSDDPAAPSDAGTQTDASAPDAGADGGSDPGTDAGSPDAGEPSILVSCESDDDCASGSHCQFKAGRCGAGFCRAMPCVGATASFELCDGSCAAAPANCPGAPFRERFADSSCGDEVLPDGGSACERYAREVCRIESVCRVSYMDEPGGLLFRGPFGARPLFPAISYARDDAACLTNALAHCTDRLALADSGLDEAEVSSCVGDLRELRSCDAARDRLVELAPRSDRNERYTSLPYCPTAAGTRPDGSGCAVDEECASGSCSRVFNLQARLDRCGTCARLRSEGEECGLDPDEPTDGWFACGGGLHCKPDAAGVPRCTAVERAIGGACGERDPWGLCASGLVCLRGACAPEKEVGDECTELFGECEPGAYCDDRIGRCVYAPEVGPGGSCFLTFPPTAGSGTCAEGGCSDEALCVIPPASTLGSDCESATCDFVCPYEFQLREGEADVCRRFTELSCDAGTPPEG